MSPPRDRYTFSNQSSLPQPLYTAIHTLLSNWDKTSDSTHAYLAAFSDNATLDLPPNKVTGHDAIRELRNSLIHPTNGPVTDVAHTFERVYVLFGDDRDEKINVAVTGSVDYTVRGGKTVTQGFATTFDLVPSNDGDGKGEGEWKVAYAKIYTDNSPLMGALAEMPPMEGSEQ